MSYSIQDLNGCTKKFVFNFEQVDLTKQIQAALVDKQRTANLKGFRKGKAPLDMVKKLFGPQVENDALTRFVSEEFYAALKKENIRAVGYPSFGNTKFEGGNSVAFEATVEIVPEIELKDFSKYTFKKDSDVVTAEDVENLKKQFLSSKAELAELTDASAKLEKGHHAVLNFEGEKADGSKPDNMKATDYMLEIGSGQFIAGFEEGMIGMKKGETKVISLNFPTDYHETELQGQPVKFKVDLLEIKERKFPELNDELAKEFGYESVEDFNKKTNDRLTVQKKRETQAKLQQEILEKMIEDNKFDVPQALIEDQKQSVKQDLSRNLKQQGFNDQMIEMYFDRWATDVDQKAAFQVRSGLILDKLAKQFNIEAKESDLDAKFEEMAQQSGMKKDELAHFYKNNANVKRNLMYAIREEKTFEKLISSMKVS
ncbi:MAG: trigger factor [Bacteriovoracaceae bacterium]|nr:trigger factor [Bacteriovoracaceae bacterium]